MFSFKPVDSLKGTANETGSGLGLLLCKDFIDKHSGKIWVESTLGQGTIISFSIPDSQECWTSTIMDHLNIRVDKL